jgi:hypothetical protein
LRRTYLFPLAAVCHVPPTSAGALRLADFAILIDGIDRMKG